MTKTISLADDAYEALARSKRPSESFSDVARCLADTSSTKSLVDFIGIWADDAEEMGKIFGGMRNRREHDFGRRVSLE